MVLVVLVLGAGAGFGASLAAGRQPAAGGVPLPVVAQSPSYPVDPEPELAPDPTSPPLPTSLPMAQGRVGTKLFRHVFPVPEGWTATPNSSGETKWTNPDNPPQWTYLLRVEQVGSENRTVARMLEDRIADLDRDEESFRVVAQTTDTIVFTYVTDRHRRYGIVRWLTVDASPFAEVEVAATGREVDVPGMEALVAAVTAGLRRA